MSLFNRSKTQLPFVVGRSPQWRDISISLSPFGKGWVLTSLILVAAAWIYQLNLAAWVGLMSLGVLIIQLIWNARQLIGLQIDVKLNQEVFVGDLVRLKLIAEGKSQNRFLWLNREDMPSENNDSSSAEEQWQRWDIKHQKVNECDWLIRAETRGLLKVPPLQTVSSAPFGLTIASCVWHWPSEAPVFPKPLTPPDVQDDFHHLSSSELLEKEQGEDVSHLSEHQHGMPYSRIAWKHYAKSGCLVDKQFDVADATDSDIQCISFRDYPENTPLEILVSWLCYRVLAAEAVGKHYELILPQVSVGRQVGQRKVALTALANWR